METSLHSPPPVGQGVYWAVRQDWRSPVIIGLSFIAIVIIVLLPYFTKLDRLQKETFGKVLYTLNSEELKSQPNQKECALDNKDGVFHWRGVFWKKSETEDLPYLFEIKVDGGDTHEVLSSRIIPYEEKLAWDIGVYTEIKK